jgi:ABC-2 type transport system permease protein
VTARSTSTEAPDRLDGLRLAALLSLRDYAALYPPAVLLLSTLPRIVLQVGFFSYLGYYAAGSAGRTFAFVGASAHVITMATVVRGPDVIVDERVMGTLYRARLGVLPLPATVATRWWIYTCEGFCMWLAAVLALAVPFGGASLLAHLLAAAPLLALAAVTTAAFGMAVGAVALTQRFDVVLTNLAAYALLVLCGVVAPLASFGPVGSDLVRLLPLTNGLLAVRHVVAGEAWALDALLEAAAGAGWACVAAGMLLWQERRARWLGSDDRL